MLVCMYDHAKPEPEPFPQAIDFCFMRKVGSETESNTTDDVITPKNKLIVFFTRLDDTPLDNRKVIAAKHIQFVNL